MGFGQALSGLNAASQNLDSIGNNIANSGTVGYKAGTATFADIYASSRVGLGVQVTGISQRFSSGNLELTGNQYDMAIDGEVGFFRLLSQNGEILYSRNGQFQKDKDHFIVNAQGHRLTGYPAGAIGADPVPLTVPVGNIQPRATQNITAGANFNADSPAIDPAVNPFDPNDASTFTNAAPLTIYDSLGNAHQLTQYFAKRDSGAVESNWDVYYTLDGRMVDVGTPAIPAKPAIPQIDFDFASLELQADERVVEYTVSGRTGYAIVKDATTGDPAANPPVAPTPAQAYGLVLNPADISTDPGIVTARRGNQLFGIAEQAAVSSTSPTPTVYRNAVAAVDEIPATWGDSGRLSFDLNGFISIIPPVLNLRFEDPGGVSAPAQDFEIAVNYAGSTQFGNPFRQNIQHDGYASGEFTSVSVSEDGTLVAAYSNGQTQEIGTLVLASFNNVQGLRPVGGNAWVESPEAGTPQLGQPGTNGLAVIKGQAVEASNVDLSQELVNMIIAQRTYQANAQTIKTHDQLMQTLMQMR